MFAPLQEKCNSPLANPQVREGRLRFGEHKGQNGYEETLAHKMAVSDAMHKFASEKFSGRKEKKDRYYKLSMPGCVLSPDIPRF